MGTDNGSTLTPVKSTTKHLTIPELIDGVLYRKFAFGYRQREEAVFPSASCLLPSAFPDKKSRSYEYILMLILG
ncbi:hypothetical protein N0Y54_29155 [Nostoc punctiforme UO1]|uniref:hypothetical protein n=1 Tax=Nostoc punctiforme TaxID=272131 RepID=UPI0030AA6C18